MSGVCKDLPNRSRGFTLVELLIVIAIIGIIAAIAIPGLIDAIERSKQKRTMSDMKTLAGALQRFATDFGGYPKIADSGDPFLKWPAIFEVDGTPAIIPYLVQGVPNGDGWDQPFVSQFGPEGGDIQPLLGTKTSNHFALYSTGWDRISVDVPADGGKAAITVGAAWCAPDPNANGGATLWSHCYNTDIIWGDSTFLQAPEGKQKRC